MKQTLIMFVFALCCFSVFNTQAQMAAPITVKGTITDADSGKPLEGVSVLIKNQNQGTVSNKNGHYEIQLNKEKEEIEFSYLGYKVKTIVLKYKSQNITKNISLVFESKLLDDVTISAKSESRKIREQALPVSVISMSQLQGTVSDINDVLSKTSGVKIRATGGVGSASRVSVRGLEGKRVGFFIDGTPMSDNMDFVSINDIPVDMIERIEIFKGIVPAKFGGSSIGGAVNIVLKEYPPKYLDASYTIQSFNTHKISTAMKTNKNGIEMGIGGFYTYSDNDYKMQLPLRNKSQHNNDGAPMIKRDHDQFKKIVIGGGFTSKKWYFDKIKIEPSVVISRKEIQGIEYNIQSAYSLMNAYLCNSILEKDDFLIDGLDLDFENAFTYSLYQLRDTAMLRYSWDMKPLAPISQYGGEIGKQPNDSYNQKSSLLQRLNLNYLINNNQSINLNWHYQYAYGNPKDPLKDKAIGYKTNFKSNMHSITVGVNHEYHTDDQFFTNSATLKYYYYKIKTKTIAEYGMSTIDHIDMHKSDYGISEAIRLRFSPRFLIKGSAGYDVRIPSEGELLGDGFIISPAGNLEPERNLAFNVGWMYTHNVADRKVLELEFNAFYSHLNNMIRFTGGPLQSKYENFGESKTKGIEFEAKSDITNFLYLWGNITYQDLRDSRKLLPNSSVTNPTYNERMPNIPYLFANVGFEFHKRNLLGGKGHNTRFYVDGSFVEEYFYDFEQSKFQERRIPRSLIYNAGLEHSIKDQRIFFTLQMNNITDETTVSEFNRPLPGRNYAFKIRYVFR
ncbi:MAG: TonB-dependent receptor plug domain-containing protein [Prolixibacteraceae bacterium]|jgi:outer membrane receptor protein involved in Fe transport|nr:TonB-dependent receptor plug domain-containing protein [Prolixibacteraceae bacterium]